MAKKKAVKACKKGFEQLEAGNMEKAFDLFQKSVSSDAEYLEGWRGLYMLKLKAMLEQDPEFQEQLQGKEVNYDILKEKATDENVLEWRKEYTKEMFGYSF